MSEIALPCCPIIARAATPSVVSEPVRRRPGRPQTRTREHYQTLWREYVALCDWFLAVHGRPKRTDVEVLTAYLEFRMQQNGQRTGRVKSPEVLSKIKTLRNELCIARRMHSAQSAVIHDISGD